jgi:hypothetical protein
MPAAITVLHVQGRDPLAVEAALDAVFAGEERPRALRLEGTYAAVLARVSDPDLSAAYRYLILRPHDASPWTPVLELGNRTEGLDVELSRRLDGAAVFTVFVYGDVVSGYRLARAGALVDSYLSDPTAVAEEESEAIAETTGSASTPAGADLEGVRGDPARFADLLPAGTAPDDFARVVLRPGWWEERDAGSAPATAAAGASATNDEESEEEEIVDEVDRMRCIGLALELWAPDDYPLARDPEDIPNAVAGPAVVLAYS